MIRDGDRIQRSALIVQMWDHIEARGDSDILREWVTYASTSELENFLEHLNEVYSAIDYE